jgi:hypothetical protein
MSKINAEQIISVSATIKNLIIETINGRPVNNYFSDCLSQNDGLCPDCQSYDQCLCQDDDGACPECLPYPYNPTPQSGSTGATGSTGAPGINGISSGLVLFLDGATTSSIPVADDLIPIPNTGPQTKITVNMGKSAITTEVGTFTTAVGQLLTTAIVGGYGTQLYMLSN